LARIQTGVRKRLAVIDTAVAERISGRAARQGLLGAHRTCLDIVNGNIQDDLAIIYAIADLFIVMIPVKPTIT
jgi:hypothetical protein